MLNSVDRRPNLLLIFYAAGAIREEEEPGFQIKFASLPSLKAANDSLKELGGINLVGWMDSGQQKKKKKKKVLKY